MDQAQRLRVGPLHVVGDQQQRRARGKQRAGDRAEQPPPQLRLWQRLGRRHARGQLRQQPGKVGELCSFQSRQARGDRLGAQPRRGDAVGERTLRGIGASLRRHGVSGHAELVDQPRLAEARLAGDEHELRAPG